MLTFIIIHSGESIRWDSTVKPIHSLQTGQSPIAQVLTFLGAATVRLMVPPATVAAVDFVTTASLRDKIWA